MKKKLIILLAAVIVAAGAVTAAIVIANNNRPQEPQDSSASDEVAAANSRYVDFEEGFTDVKVTDAETALQAVATVADSIGITNAEEELQVVDVSSFDGETFYRMQQVCNGVPVVSKEAILAADEQGTVVSLSANTVKIDRSKADKAENPSGFDYQKVLGMVEQWMNSTDLGFQDFTCNTLPEVVYYSPDGSAARACYSEVISFNSKEGKNYAFKVLLDCDTYEILGLDFAKNYAGRSVTASGFDNTGERREFTAYRTEDMQYLMIDEDKDMEVNTVNGNTLEVEYALVDSGNHLYIIKNGNIYDEHNNIVYISDDETAIVDAQGNVLGTGLRCGFYVEGSPKNNIEVAKSSSSVWSDANAVTAVSRVQNIYDFYESVLGRKTFNGKNGTIYVFYDDYADGDTTNAYSCTFGETTLLAFGKDNKIAFDTVGHEYTHSVISSIVDLPYSGESGAINEAYADVFGELCEDFSDGAFDGSNNWKVDDFRNIADPNRDGNPSVYKGRYWSPTFSIPDILKGTPLEIIDMFTDKGGVHSNCTVLSHAAYLMNQGVDGNSAKKIDNETLAKIWYRSMFMLHSDETFVQCASHVYQAAARTGGLTRQQLSCVREAFAEVGLPVEEAAPVSVRSGATVFALDKNGSRYAGYHLTVKAENGSTAAEADVRDDNGYALSVPEGTYELTVTDLSGGGSVTQKIKVVPSYRREGQNYINILTDF